jgi:hypothetical protein
MAQANAAFLRLSLSVLSGAALLVGLAPGCNGNNTPPPSVALQWAVEPGQSTSCGAVYDHFSIGDDGANPIQTSANGDSVNGVPITVNCDVAPNGGGYSVSANAVYGNQGQLSIKGQINVAQGATTPGPQTGITGTFSDHVAGGFIANLTDTQCTITFDKKAGMGIAPTRIWGYLDCPNAATTNGQTCDGHAEFLFEYCGQ